MKTVTSICIALFLAFSATLAVAAPKRKPAPDMEGSSAAAKCEAKGKFVRRCLVEGNAAELPLRISKDGGQIFMTLGEPATLALKDKFITTQMQGNSVVFLLNENKIPKGHKIVIRTKSMVLTLTFKVVSSGSDSQVQIVRADKADRDLVVDERVRMRVAELEKEHRATLNALDAKAGRLARKRMLNQLQDNKGGRIAKPSGEVHAREDFLVFRALTTIRIGDDRVLEVSVEERKGDTFAIEKFNVSISQAGAKRALDPEFRCDAMRVLPGETVKCFISLGAISKRRGRAKVDIRVEGEDGRRSVRLRKVNIH